MHFCTMTVKGLINSSFFLGLRNYCEKQFSCVLFLPERPLPWEIWLFRSQNPPSILFRFSSSLSPPVSSFFLSPLPSLLLPSPSLLQGVTVTQVQLLSRLCLDPNTDEQVRGDVIIAMATLGRKLINLSPLPAELLQVRCVHHMLCKTTILIVVIQARTLKPSSQYDADSCVTYGTEWAAYCEQTYVRSLGSDRS